MHRSLVRLLCVVACVGAVAIADGRAMGQSTGGTEDRADGGGTPALCEQVTRAELDCGIEIIVFEVRDGDSGDDVQVWTRIHRGSMTEMEDERGASVIASRAMMGGVPGLTGDEIQELFRVEGEGAYSGSHALVMGDHVVVQLGVKGRDDVATGLGLARALVDGYAPSDASIERARESLLGELDEIESNRVEQKMHQRWLPALLPGSDYGKLPIPDREQCRSLGADAVRGFIAREWTPGQSSVLVVGDVDAGVVIEQARGVFDGCADRGQTPMCRGRIIDPAVNGHVVAMNEPLLGSSRLGLVCFGDQGAVDWSNGGFDEQLIQMMAGEAMRYRVNRMLRRDFPDVIDARVDVGLLMGRVGFGQIVVELEGAEDETRWAAVLEGMEIERLRLMRDGLSEQEIERARGWTIQQLGYEVDQWTGASTRERARAMNWMLTMDRPLVDLERWIGSAGEMLGRVEKSRVDAELRRMFGQGDPAVLVLLDGDESADESAIRGVLDRARSCEIGELAGDWIDSMHGPILNRSGRGGEVDEITVHQASGTVSAQLSNGVVVHHREMLDPDEPGVVQMCVRLGFDSIESAEMHGAGDVLVEAMERGMIRTRTESEIRGIMIEHGIELEIEHGTWGVEFLVRSGVGSDESFERGVELVYGLLTDLRIELGLIEELGRAGEDGSRVLGVPIGAMEIGIARALGGEDAIGFGDGRDRRGFGAGVEARSVRRWIAERVRNGELEIGIAGGIGAEEGISLCAEYFGSIPRSGTDFEASTAQDLVAVVDGEETVRVADESGREGVLVGFGGCGVDDLEGMRALAVAGMVLDRRFEKIAEEVQRDEGGEIAVSGGALTLDLVPGRVVMFGRVDCDPGEIDGWASVLQGELERMAVDGVTDEELREPLERIDGMIGGGFDGLGFWSRRLARLGVRGGDVESIWSMRRAYRTMRASEVNRVYGAWYRDGEHFRVDLVNDARE